MMGESVLFDCGTKHTGPDGALAALWRQVLVQGCTAHKHRNLLARAPKKMHDKLGATTLTWHDIDLAA
jgi:transposase-like protein